MTKFTLLLAMGVSAFCAPAFAQQMGPTGFGTNTASSDPCVLGTNVQPGACVGPVRVAPVILSQGSIATNQQQSFAASPQYRSLPSNGPTIIAPQQAPIMQQQVMQQQFMQPQMIQSPVFVSSPSVQTSGPCVPAYQPVMTGCTGNNQGGFVPNGYAQGYNQNFTSAPQFAPVPVVQYQQAPQYFAPAPQYFAPAPVQFAPVQYAPVQYAPQTQLTGSIPLSFFTGGITYGAGFPEGGGFSGGGGGGIFISGGNGGTRFSGVRERSPTPLIAPPMRQRQPSHAPPKHCGHC
jgi:hypothetical protein